MERSKQELLAALDMWKWSRANANAHIRAIRRALAKVERLERKAIKQIFDAQKCG